MLMTEETKEVEQEEKAHLIGMDGPMIPVSVTSFEDLDAMRQAGAMADAMKDKTIAFAEMAENIFLNEEIEDKAVALQNLAGEFGKRVSDVASNPPEVKEVGDEQLTKEQMHYKEVLEDDTKTIDSDFQGGCKHCGFGQLEAIKSLDKCPFCHIRGIDE